MPTAHLDTLGILYESRGGQTEKIARRMAEAVKELVGEVQVADIRNLPAELDLGEFDAVILGAPIYYSRHTGGMKAFILDHRESLSQRPSFFFSVSLNANSESKRRGVAERYVTKFLARTGWTPRATATLAGAVLYRDYNWFIRFLMKCLVASHGGQTDTSRNYEYTKWELVEKFARECAGSLGDNV
jgi:menaquinone-dependent protoporphyrinogen oxidase